MNPEVPPMSRLAVRSFALIAYGAFVGAFTYLIGFVSGIGVSRTVDGLTASPGAAIAIDVALVGCFGVAHSVMARPRFKRAWTRVVPPAAERSVYVLVASAQIALLCWQWRPIGEPVLWRTTGAAAVVVQAVAMLGWGISLVSSHLIDHFELFGLRQAFGAPRAVAVPVLRTPLFYRWVRHPLYFGMLVGLWVTPVMTAGHVLLAGLFTAYTLIGVRHEERDLVRVFGDAYRRYQWRVPMLLPMPRRAGTALDGPLSRSGATE
jgi:protein-S-isoprenylcysteine O-methyltransferase Ste14